MKPSLRGLWLLLLPAVALADEPVVKLGGLLDARYARTDAERSWLDGGFGKLRYGASVDGRSDLFRLAQLSLLLDAELGPLLTVHVQANLDAEPDQAGLRGRADLIEAFALYRPELSPSLRLRIRGGAFFPPVSLEHEGPAWTSPYTITSSAANSWIGEEVRTIGAEGALVLKHDAYEMRLLGAGFGGNDPAGSLLAWRGWALHDRQSGLGDRLVYPPLPSLLPGGPFAENARWAGPFVEIDGRVGWYAGASLHGGGRFDARALHYDSRGKQTVFDGKQYAWLTRFDAFGLRIELPQRIVLLSQHLRGETVMGKAPDGQDLVRAPFQTTYALLSVPLRRHRLSLRYERFLTRDQDALTALDPNQEDGDAWTACYAFEPSLRQRLALELVHVEAERAARRGAGLQPLARETLFQASWRIAF